MLEVLSDASEEEKSLLKNFQYSKNIAYLHRDETLMPHNRSIWSSWNYLKDADPDKPIVLTYWMNRLQHFLPRDLDLFVTLNPDHEPKPEKTYKKIIYHHPIYLVEGIAAQQKLRTFPGTQNTYFCGAYLGYGFHEDGMNSGLEVAEKLGAKLPFQLDRSRYITKPRDPPGIHPRVYLRIIGALFFAIFAFIFGKLFME